MSLSRYQLWYGRDAAPIERHELRAGPVTAQLEGADLRHMRVGGVELVQRIYVAVRDEVWNTIPATYSDWTVDLAPDHFAVRFAAHHQYRDIDFSWQGTITGTPDGVIAYTMDGIAHAVFQYCKIGFNIHHPLQGFVGRPYHATTPEGPISGVLPAEIVPQRFENGRLTALFPEYSALTLDLEGGLRARFDFTGDLFEMQDHRNWTDANYKTYGTPMSIPVPMTARDGQVMRQTVTVSVAGALPRPAASPGQERITLGGSTGRSLPPIGAMMASHGGALSAHEADLLRRLRLDHLRVDLRLSDPAYRAGLAQAVDAARALDTEIELALFVAENAEAALVACAALLQVLPVPLARILVFPDAAGFSSVGGSTPASVMRRVRERLGPAAPGVPLAGGTNLFFADLNRDHPDIAAMDAVVYSINPQVHASDNTSLVENLPAQRATVEMARTFCGDRPIVISPVTLIGRAGPYAAGPPQPDGLPGNVDVRQASLFGAGWTMGSVAYLARSGVASLTYYETTGWLGIVETDDGAPRPDLFPSIPGGAFPLYHVLADLVGWKGAELLDIATSDPLAVDGLAVRVDGLIHALIANLSPRQQIVTVGPLGSERVYIRRLDEETAALATSAPEQFRASGALAEVSNNLLTITLRPYAVLRVDELDGS